MTGFAGARNDGAFSRRVRTRVLLHKKRKAPAPIPSDGAGGGTGIHLDRARRMKSGRRNADRRVCPTSAPATFILPRLRGRTEEGTRRASSGTRSPVGVPPRRLRQRTNAAAQLQHALPGSGRHQALPEAGLSQSSELLADRSWCRPGVFPEPPENGSDEPPSAGTALAPAAGVTPRPSCKLSEIRDVCTRNGDKSQATVAISETVWQLPEGWSAATLSVLSLLAWGKTGCKRPQPRRSTFCATTQARP